MIDKKIPFEGIFSVWLYTILEEKIGADHKETKHIKAFQSQIIRRYHLLKTLKEGNSASLINDLELLKEYTEEEEILSVTNIGYLLKQEEILDHYSNEPDTEAKAFIDKFVDATDKELAKAQFEGFEEFKRKKP